MLYPIPSGMATAPPEKATVRRELRTELNRLSGEQRRACSLLICERLAPLIRNVDTVALFAPQPDEPDLQPLERFGLWRGRTVLFPVIAGAALAFAPAG